MRSIDGRGDEPSERRAHAPVTVRASLSDRSPTRVLRSVAASFAADHHLDVAGVEMVRLAVSEVAAALTFVSPGDHLADHPAGRATWVELVCEHDEVVRLTLERPGIGPDLVDAALDDHVVSSLDGLVDGWRATSDGIEMYVRPPNAADGRG